MTSFNNGYKTTEPVDQELNFDQLQDINAGAASDNVMKKAPKIILCEGEPLEEGSENALTFPVSGSVAHALELFFSSGTGTQISFSMA